MIGVCAGVYFWNPSAQEPQPPAGYRAYTCVKTWLATGEVETSTLYLCGDWAAFLKVLGRLNYYYEGQARFDLPGQSN